MKRRKLGVKMAKAAPKSGLPILVIDEIQALRRRASVTIATLASAEEEERGASIGNIRDVHFDL